MKKILLCLMVFMFAVGVVLGQDSGTQQQIDKLSGQIQDLLAAQEQQGKQLAALSKQISDLSDKVNTPAVSDSASRDDLKTLATQVQEIDKKRQADRDLILKQIENLGKLSAAPSRKAPPTTAAADDTTTAPATPPASRAPRPTSPTAGAPRTPFASRSDVTPLPPTQAASASGSTTSTPTPSTSPPTSPPCSATPRARSPTCATGAP